MARQGKNVPHPDFNHLPLATSGPTDCALSGTALLRSPYLNKGSAFSQEERQTFGLGGLLPLHVQTLEQQVSRAYAQYSSRHDALAKNTFMTSMKEQNEVLYYRLLLSHLKEMFSIIYTPTEGDAIANYSRLFRKPEGCFLNINEPTKNDISNAISKWGDADDIDLIVVSDAEQILGIGDQGVGGVLISIAKLVLYTACAGIHPHRTLPIILDCGTDNVDLRNDGLYLGNQHERIRGGRYNEFIDNFFNVAREQFPKTYLHCEDFGLTNARRILDQYRGKVPVFNDDVQGTGCVTLAAVQSALKVTDIKISDARVICYGAGTAGTGIADMICQAMAVESGKREDDAARANIWCIDKPGLLTSDHVNDLTHGQRPYVKDASETKHIDTKSLEAVINHVKPNILIGTSTQPGAFTESVVKAMASHVDHPIIFPLSNPTRLHEAVPSDLLQWTNGKALVATGSPFDPVKVGEGTFEISECNNSTVFPGIGLGGVLARVSLVTDKMLVAATQAVASTAPALQDRGKPDARKGLLPDVADVRKISVKIAVAVIRAAQEEGVATERDIPDEDDVVEEWVREQMWDAEYRPLRKVNKHEASRLAKGEAGSARSQHASDSA